MMSLKPYNEMNTEEVMIHWKRVRYAHCLGLYESPNHVLWELINESKRVTLQRWDTNTGSIYKEEKPLSGYPWTCGLRGIGVGPEYGGCTRELGAKKKEAQP